METWQKRLAHERACRDGLVACGNPAPKLPDPEGGLYRVQCRIYNGAVFFAHINALGHDAAPYDECKCSKGS